MGRPLSFSCRARKRLAISLLSVYRSLYLEKKKKHKRNKIRALFQTVLCSVIGKFRFNDFFQRSFLRASLFISFTVIFSPRVASRKDPRRLNPPKNQCKNAKRIKSQRRRKSQSKTPRNDRTSCNGNRAVKKLAMFASCTVQISQWVGSSGSQARTAQRLGRKGEMEWGKCGGTGLRKAWPRSGLLGLAILAAHIQVAPFKPLPCPLGEGTQVPLFPRLHCSHAYSSSERGLHPLADRWERGAHRTLFYSKAHPRSST